jgi:hypothetical protein
VKKSIIAILMTVVPGAAVLADDLDQALGITAAAQPGPEAQVTKLIAGLSMWGIIWGILFSSVGVYAFLFGKKKSNAAFMVIGILLIAYPYVVQQTYLVALVGAVLTVSLYFFRR